MNPELDAALVRDFPHLYRDRHSDTMRTRMCDGFAVDDGWELLIRRLSEKLEPIARKTGLYAVQVKEKFGGLRFYVEKNASDEAESAIDAAEEESFRICERCGAAGSTREYGNWLSTLCDTCHEHEVERRMAQRARR